jgi:CheY-like chemotaxis protein
VCGEAENGRDAIEKGPRVEHPDLIVTDLSMPNMNGLEEARLLKQLMPHVSSCFRCNLQIRGCR